jgi:putative inorganic carbon (hco3(-)) transporter
MINTVWQQVTLSALPLHQWRQASFLQRPVGFLRSWRKNSTLMQWSDHISTALLSTVFILSPVVSTDLIGWLLGACSLYWILLTLSDDTDDTEAMGLTPIHLTIALFWSVCAVSAGFSSLKVLAFAGLGKLTLYLLFFAFMARVLRSPRVRSWVIGVFLHVALVVSIYGLRQLFFGADATATWVDPTSPTAQTVRVYSFLGNPNLLAAYLIPASAFSIAAIFAWQKLMPKILAIVMTVINLTCLFQTQSRGGWIGLALMLLVFFVLLVYWWSPHLPRFWRVSALPIMFGGLATVVVLGFLFVKPFQYRVLSIFAGSGDSSNAFRINVWRASFNMFLDHPMIGIGPGDGVFKKVYARYQQARFSALSAYSILLEIAVETGVIGLTAFLWFLFVTFHQGYLQLQRLRELANRDGFWLIGAIALAAGMLGHGIVDTVWYRPSVNVLWWLGVAVIASFYTYRQTLTSHEDVEDLATNP